MSEVLKNDSSPVIRHEVAFILGTVKTPQSVALLMEAIEDDPSDLVRHEAIEALGDIGIWNKNVLVLLKKSTKDKNSFIKDTAKIALATIKP
jgi:deoxyhypusine monooxygenase